LIGDAAKNQAAMNPNTTIFDAERLIGHNLDGPVIQHYMKHLPLKVIGKDGNKLHMQGMQSRFPLLCMCLFPSAAHHALR
jgi:heat shock protein 5